MKLGEKGYTLIELLIAITIMVTASGAAGGAIFQVIRNTQRNNDHMTVVSQVQNAGYWISRDAQMALSANATADLMPPDFLLLSWPTWNDDGTLIIHSARYFLEDLTDGTRTLKRNYLSGAGANQTTLIAQYIYYNPDDATNTSNTTYESKVLTVKLTAVFEQEMESREYQIKGRPDF